MPAGDKESDKDFFYAVIGTCTQTQTDTDRNKQRQIQTLTLDLYRNKDV